MSEKMTVEDVKQALRYTIQDCFKLYRNRAKDICNRGIAAGLSVDDIVKAFDAVDPLDVFDKPVPKEAWESVADYCCNDVLATEAAFYYLEEANDRS